MAMTRWSVMVAGMNETARCAVWEM
jgi:hypothetical protein